jgi:hypothetical protein
LRIAATAVATVAIAYGWGAVAGPHLFDAGELVAAGVRLGASHAPGQPLHALLAWGATLFPFGPIAFRVSLLSVALAGAAAFSAARIVDDALARMGATDRGVVWLPAATAVGVLLAPPIAPQIGRPEVYTLALALALEGARQLVAWAARDSGAGAALRRAALLAGLAVAVHPPHALALLAVGAALLVALRRDVLRAPRAIGGAALACVAGMLAIAYLPLRAAAGAPTWGDARSASGLLAYLAGSAYRHNLGFRGGASAIGGIVDVLGYVVVPSGLVAIAALTLIAGRRSEMREGAARAALPAIGGSAAAALVAACLQPLQPANPDNVAYAGPAAALAIALGGAALGVTARAAGRTATGVGAVALGLAPLAGGDPGAALRADVPALETLAFALTDAPPPRALVVVRTDFVAAAWMQAQAAESARPDVALLVEGLSTSSWHWRGLAQHPLYDGTPIRSGEGRGYAPWVRGAIMRAVGAVAIASEHDDPVEGRGVVCGPYLLLPTEHVESWRARFDRAFAERTIGAPARMIRYGPGGYADNAHGVIREIEIARAWRLLIRGRTALAIAALRRASAPLPAGATAIAEGVVGPPQRSAPPVIRDPNAIFATAEDAVRELAALLYAAGEPARSAALLEAQQARQDDRALLQLAWMLAEDGMIAEARSAVARYRDLRGGDRDVEALEARLRDHAAAP